ncbi:hypothetical protein [Aminobacter sp. AP02]|uniref:hypothetical protein n=1 Tax=Aminobacter sp. AP02 TaxID=2135737 RepID=UPI0011B29C56|nr:hypothetical protein [Aminobacter sp. AP02]
MSSRNIDFSQTPAPNAPLGVIAADLPLTQTSILVISLFSRTEFPGIPMDHCAETGIFPPFQSFVTLWQQSGEKWIHQLQLTQRHVYSEKKEVPAAASSHGRG